MRRRLAPILAVVFAACGSHPPTTPSSTAPPPTAGASNAPTAAIDVKADAAGSRDAIASLSEVIVDTSASTGTGLSFAIDFGDGATATTATAKHVYAAPATYTVTATVTDSQGRKATDTRQIAVRDATGNWFQAGYVAKTKRVEVRRLGIDAQDGTTVRGTYRVTGDFDRTFTGTLIPPRDIRMSADRGVMIEGTLPSRLNDDATLWTLIAHGDSADGQRLDFRPVTSVPDGPPPAASFKMSVAGDLVYPIAGVTPVHVDASASRGSGLSYFLEYGDGFLATTAQADHVVDAPNVPGVTARVTVVDRSGRSNEASLDYQTFDFGTTATYGNGNMFWHQYSEPTMHVVFKQRSGGEYGGWLQIEAGQAAPFTLTVSDDTRVHLSVPQLGVEFDGTVDIKSNVYSDSMTLIQRGGKFDGKTHVLKQYSDY